jgi:hypothetical protein
MKEEIILRKVTTPLSKEEEEEVLHREDIEEVLVHLEGIQVLQEGIIKEVLKEIEVQIQRIRTEEEEEEEVKVHHVEDLKEVQHHIKSREVHHREILKKEEKQVLNHHFHPEEEK